MQAALISLVLMSGACGQVPDDEMGTYYPGQMPEISVPHLPVTVSMPVGSVAPSCPSCGKNNFAVPPLYQGCPQYEKPEMHTQPAWDTNYHPAIYFYHRMLFHPADYTQPYPYRERFNYPWNDPRCRCAIPPIGY